MQQMPLSQTSEDSRDLHRQAKGKGLKPLTMVHVFLLVDLGVDRLTKACNFCNCLSSDLQ